MYGWLSGSRDNKFYIVKLNMNKTFDCKRCGYSWSSRIDSKPKACPRCKNYCWDKDKRKNKNDKHI